MSERAPLLIEIGCEELPADAQRPLAEALARGVTEALGAHGLMPDLRAGWTPRRLIVHAPDCPCVTPDRVERLWGPPARLAFDADGAPTQAALGFARKVGVSADALGRAPRPDRPGEDYLFAERRIAGRPVGALLAEAMPAILRRLPLPKRMRWAEGDARADEFLRPIRWIVALIGEEVIPFAYAGVMAGRSSRGHRVHGGEGPIDVADPFGWWLARRVLADPLARQRRIEELVRAAAAQEGLEVVPDAALVEEVAGLVEWPHALLCRFDADFLRLPEAVIRVVLCQHQRCFAVRDGERLAPAFVAVTNLEPADADAARTIRIGNERVVRARLSDAMFYFERDPKVPLADRVERLAGVVYQDGLGTMRDLTARLVAFVRAAAEAAGCPPAQAERAAWLCKADLTTGLVYEFPELQGEIGGVYARMNGEDEAVARAIAEHYRPEGAEDALPESPIARLIGVAERADKLLGYFALGERPTATRDPFGLRRAAMGLVRLLVDPAWAFPWPLARVLATARANWRAHPPHREIAEEVCAEVEAFVVERLLGMADKLGTTRAALEAALAAEGERTLAAHLVAARLLARFAASEDGASAAAANKRVANILRKAGVAADAAEVDPTRLREPAERTLWAALVEAERDWPDAPEAQLARLAALRAPVDRFFDEVLVMADDLAVRANRLALLARLRALFLRLGDFSLL